MFAMCFVNVRNLFNLFSNVFLKSILTFVCFFNISNIWHNIKEFYITSNKKIHVQTLYNIRLENRDNDKITLSSVEIVSSKLNTSSMNSCFLPLVVCTFYARTYSFCTLNSSCIFDCSSCIFDLFNSILGVFVQCINI